MLQKRFFLRARIQELDDVLAEGLFFAYDLVGAQSYASFAGRPTALARGWGIPTDGTGHDQLLVGSPQPSSDVAAVARRPVGQSAAPVGTRRVLIRLSGLVSAHWLRYFRIVSTMLEAIADITCKGSEVLPMAHKFFLFR